TSEAIPWITALSHPQVVLLTLLATFAALKAECERRPALWGLSLFAAALAPLAHESGAIAGAIVGGYVLLHCGARSWRRWLLAGACVAVAGVVILGRTFIPGAYVGTELDGLPDLFQNAMFFLHGVLYPLGPAIGVAVQRWGWHDFTLLGILAAGLAGLLVWLTSRSNDRRWTLRNLWWWAAAALPAAVSLKYGAFFVGERLYALAAPGIAMLWAAIIVELGARLPRGWGRRLLVAGLVGGLLAQNVAYLRHKRALYVMLDDVYDEVLATTAAADEAAALAFVNLPASLTWTERTYALTTESAVFVPWAYSNLGEFVEVNQGWRDIVTASHGPLFQETEPFWITQGPWLEGGALRAFLEGRDGVWLGRWWDPEGRFVLLDVGALAPGAPAPEADPRAHFEGGPALVDAALRRVNASHAEIAFTWYAAGAVDAAVFVHVRDAQGNVIAQADGGALHGMLPLGLWQAGDLIHDVRHILLPEEVAGPLDVFVGVYQGDTRFPAFVAGDRVPDEAVFVGRIPELESAATP
ncbi:MAG: hypothetical protein JXB35_11730, partial [Anaerolineae bacterium]|nr:hypothetical protein [Anaerolineae bacterium]